jgi:hypothetical protein
MPTRLKRSFAMQSLLLIAFAGIILYGAVMQKNPVMNGFLTRNSGRRKLLNPCSKWNKLGSLTRQCYANAFEKFTSLLEIDQIVIKCSKNISTYVKHEQLSNKDDVKGFVDYRKGVSNDGCISLTLGIGKKMKVLRY